MADKPKPIPATCCNRNGTLLKPPCGPVCHINPPYPICIQPANPCCSYPGTSNSLNSMVQGSSNSLNSMVQGVGGPDADYDSLIDLLI